VSLVLYYSLLLYVQAPTRFDVFPEYFMFQGNDDLFRRSNRASGADGGKVRVIRAPPLPPPATAPVAGGKVEEVHPAEYTLSFIPRERDEWRTMGDNPQLWTMAAVHYFGQLPSSLPLAKSHGYVIPPSSPTPTPTPAPLESQPSAATDNLKTDTSIPSVVVSYQPPSLHAPPPETTLPIKCELPRGARPSDLPIYCPPQLPRPPSFRCRDDTADIPWHSINDDYCDCTDGSDEPGKC
jgi:hypothetical protein